MTPAIRQPEQREPVWAVMHRDIKPENMLEASRRTRLTESEREAEEGRRGGRACLCGPGEALCVCRQGAPAREISDRQTWRDCQEARVTERAHREICDAIPTNFQMKLKAPSLGSCLVSRRPGFAGHHSAHVAPGRATWATDVRVQPEELAARPGLQGSRGRA